MKECKLMTKKELWGLLFSFLLVVGIGYQIQRQNEESPSSNILKPMGGLENIGDDPKPVPHSAAPATLPQGQAQPAANPATMTPPEEKNPVKTVADFFTSAAKPQSLEGILAQSKPFKLPRLPNERYDGGLAGVFKGYILTSQNKYQRIGLSAEYSPERGDFYSKLTLHNAGSKVSEFDSSKNLQQLNFGEDLYSYVFKLPDQRVLYLKYFNVTINDHPARVLSGWLFTLSPKSTERVALMDEPSDATENSWPSAQNIVPFFPLVLIR
jgi:hypothetical protein